MPEQSLFVFQLKGIIYRRLLILRGTWISFLANVIFFTIFTCIPVFIPLIFDNIKGPVHKSTISFKSFRKENLSIARIRTPECADGICFPNVTDIIKQFAKEEAEVDLNVIDFDSFDDFNKWQYNRCKTEHHTMNVAFAFQIKSSTEFIVANETDKLTVEFDYDYMYNRTEPDLDVDVSDIIKRALFKAFHPEDPKADINVYWESKQLKGFDSSALFDSAICLLGPLFIPLASLSLLSITLGILIDDIQTPMRPYMIASGLSRKAYWIGNYIFDFGISTIYSLILIAIYESVENVLFRKLAYISIPFILISNIVTIPYTYFWAFIFKSKTIGTGVYSVVNTVLLIAMMVVKSVLSNKKTADMIGGAFSILPFIASLNVISSVANQLIELRFNVPKKYNFFSTGPQRTAIVMFFIDLFLWPIIVSFEEYLIFFATKTMSKMGWTGHEGEFRREKDKHMRTKEATDMEQTILNSSSSENYVIKIRDVSKHFVDSNGKSIYAVNQVSLGIKQGSLFGFLGSNGAGKTTLMKMILKEEPLSNGSIEVEGLDIDLAFDPTRIAICPQFDDHLTKELTGYQNLKFFCYIL